MYSRASALLLLLLKLVVSVLEMASNKRKAKKMLKFKENDIAAHCITGREYLVRSIRENKCGQRRSCEMMKMLPVSFLLVLVSQIFLTTVI